MKKALALSLVLVTALFPLNFAYAATLDANFRYGSTLDVSSGNPADDSGNGSTITNNGTITYTTGKVNNGATMGASKYFSTTDNAFVSQTGDTTWSVWWYPTTLNAQNSFFDKWNFAAANREFEVWVDYSGGTSKISLQISNNGTGSTYNYLSTTGISVNNWYHIVWVYTASSGQLEAYLNGSSLGTATGFSTSIFNGNSTLSMGQFTGTGGNLAGMIDMPYIFNYAISSSDVATLYNSGNGKQPPFASASAVSYPLILSRAVWF